MIRFIYIIPIGGSQDPSEFISDRVRVGNIFNASRQKCILARSTSAGENFFEGYKNIDTYTDLDVGANKLFELQTDLTAPLKVLGQPVRGGSGGAAPHDILSATHTDTLAAAVIRGDLLVGNSTPRWARLPIGTAGTILRSDGTDPSWTSLNSLSWSLLGNSGTVDGTNFIGTTDNIPFNIRVNNQKAGRIDNTNANTFFGFQSGNANTTGVENTANGFQALYSNTAGFDNTANGKGALYSNTTGNNNTSNGVLALTSNTTGNNNTANGVLALSQNTTGNNNTANGYFALQSNTAGFDNTANGKDTLYTNTIGSNNTANGVKALFSTTGSNNTAVAYQSLISNTTGSNNTAIGYNADVGSGDLTNAIAIGANAIVSASNSLVLGSGANVGIGTSSPTAKLNLGAGTATASTAPLKFTSGINLTAVEAGALEYDGTQLYFTNSDAVRQQLARVITASAVLDFASTPGRTSSDLTIALTGAAVGDPVCLGFRLLLMRILVL